MKEVIKVKVLPDYKLLLTFDDNVKKIKDMKPYLEKGVFQKLKNNEFFRNVKIAYGTISWGEGIDMCADNLYETSQIVGE